MKKRSVFKSITVLCLTATSFCNNITDVKASVSQIMVGIEKMGKTIGMKMV